MITIKTLVEIAGFPESHVNEIMEKIIEKLEKENGIKIIKKNVGKAEKVKEMYSSFADLELDVDNLQVLMGFCFDYTPTSIEIVDIKELTFKVKELTNSLNDMLAKLHQYNYLVTNIHAENTVLKQKLEKSPK